MKSGLLWYDADSQTRLPDKIARAARRYLQKHGRFPTLCYVHPAALGDGEMELSCHLDEGITIRVRLVAAAQVLPHHFWLGEEPAAAAGRPARSSDHAEEKAARSSDPALLEQERPLRRGARRRREEDRLLQEALAVRSGERRQQAAKRARS